MSGGARSHGAVSGAAGLGRHAGGFDLHRVSPAGAVADEMVMDIIYIYIYLFNRYNIYIYRYIYICIYLAGV